MYINYVINYFLIDNCSYLELRLYFILRLVATINQYISTVAEITTCKFTYHRRSLYTQPLKSSLGPLFFLRRAVRCPILHVDDHGYRRRLHGRRNRLLGTVRSVGSWTLRVARCKRFRQRCLSPGCRYSRRLQLSVGDYGGAHLRG